MEPELTYEAFAKTAHTKFMVQVDDTNKLELELIEVTDQKLTGNQEEFTLTFRGTNDCFLGQGTRLFEHDQIGTFVLFIVPVNQNSSGFYYEAVFNRFLTA
jgi:hypothetical protein